MLGTLPAPIGPLVTGLLPVLAGAATATAVWAGRRERWVIAAMAAGVAVLALAVVIAFFGYATSRS